MPAWKAFAQAAPEIAAFGYGRLYKRVAYLGTVRADGGPRVHPVTPIIDGENLFLFMEPTSPKGKDLQRTGEYTLHCGVEDATGGSGEFYVRGSAALTADPVHREAATLAGYKPKDHYILFVLSIEYAFANTYENDGPHTRRWQSD